MASGALSMVVTPLGATTYNLTSLGPADWVDYPTTSGVRKSGGNLITVSHVGNFTDNVATDSKVTTTWSNGTPTASGSSTSLIFSSTGVGIGYSVVFPADTQRRTVKIVAGTYNANQRILATLSDASAPQAIDTSIIGSASSGMQASIDIQYRAANPNQTLTVSIVSTSQGSSSNTSFQAAALSLPMPVMPADGASFAFTGNSANAYVQRKLTAQTGVFSLNGNPTGSVGQRTLATQTATYAFSGSAANFPIQHKLTSQPGSFVQSGSATTFKVVRALSANAGAFVLSGKAAALTYQPKPSPTGPTYTLTSSSATFVFAGNSASLLLRRRLYVVVGAYALSGRAAAFKIMRRVSANPGVFSIQGAGVIFTFRSTAGLIDASLIPESRHAVFSASSRKAVFQVTSRIARF